MSLLEFLLLEAKNRHGVTYTYDTLRNKIFLVTGHSKPHFELLSCDEMTQIGDSSYTQNRKNHQNGPEVLVLCS